ncbi:MAG: bifunctional adenosylcobinamide kinase/adenosylcobinamide-phosphate guanylyltransferase [Pseudomonadota bacterium]
MTAATTHFLLGGARSGKSRRAQLLAEATADDRVFIATAEPLDEEMGERIARHQAERGPGWQTVEAPIGLANAIAEHAAPGRALVVDCLTLWLSNLMHHGQDPVGATAVLVGALEAAAGPVFLVSNEVGLGLVPGTPLGRSFRDEQGRLNQAVAAACDRVELVVAGLPMSLKGG